MRDFFQDVRLAFRSFVQAPGFTVVAVLSLGLGIGSMSTIYLWTDRFILNPLPTVPGGDELTFVRTRGPEDAIYSISYPTFRDWSERNRAFEGLAVMTLERVGVRERDGEAVERAFALLVSGNYFDVMQVRALHGRTFYPDEDSSAAQVAVLGHDYWQRRFRGDPGIVGRGIVINGQRVEVVGVMPPRFGGSYVGLDLDLYLPVSNYRALNLGRSRLDDRGSMFLEGIGRRKPGISLADAQADMERVGRELDADLPEASNHAVVEPLDGQGAPSTMKPIFFALLGVTALVLLIACANVANLLLARAGSREREIAVRAAIGAGRLRLIRQLLTESVLLALGGATVGLFLAYLGRGALVEMLPPAPFPVDFRFDMNYRVVGFGLVAALGTVLLFGVWPAFRATRPDLAPVLRSLPSGSIAKSAARSVLVGGQMALAVVALVSAGLFLRAIDRSRRLDPGFAKPETLLLVDTDLSIAGLDGDNGPPAVAALLDRLRSVPGVVDASTGSFVPLGWSCCNSASAEPEGYTPRPNENTSVVYSRVSPRYFETMGIPVRSGRTFQASDDRTAPRVVLVNESFVRRYWNGLEPIGRRIRQAGADFTVIGVVADGKYRTLASDPFPIIYRSFAQSYTEGFTIHVRADGDPSGLVNALRREFLAVNPDLPFLSPRTMRQEMQQSTIGQEIGSRTLAVFGAIALLLAAVGVYGVMSFLVTQRTREIGIRVALGAAAGTVSRLVIGRGLRITLIGAAVGVVAALGAGRLLQGLLLGVSPADPLTFAAIVFLLVAVAVVACLVPARRAARIDPVISLKAE